MACLSQQEQRRRELARMSPQKSFLDIQTRSSIAILARQGRIVLRIETKHALMLRPVELLQGKVVHHPDLYSCLEMHGRMCGTPVEFVLLCLVMDFW